MLEEWLYRRLITSPRFHYYVRVFHAMVNNLPPPQPPRHMRGPQLKTGKGKVYNATTFKPTTAQKWNAYLKIWKEEMKDSFLFRK
ncbi:hypothetical protein PICMEDRAFT_17759 [Pichia membranifaciens NRRL Y-2026]|uniref:Uncharacterized protein n=1 Tax=Pichia membranifaciens NRRL Y-2026 TaxID=763406 RepID=A0A1E3NGJ6_9ASCO|nr:hypothetical protein PICMEDRAFT_17759 [Pichia membranifaciens NRRL Y-2026]ODQ45275.1 hypothetical protein PICMEDRAFT_17759 [Pichia membranifaciens NRRL Y-2026]